MFFLVCLFVFWIFLLFVLVLSLVDLDNSSSFDENRLGDDIICHPNS